MSVPRRTHGAQSDTRAPSPVTTLSEIVEAIPAEFIEAAVAREGEFRSRPEWPIPEHIRRAQWAGHILMVAAGLMAEVTA